MLLTSALIGFIITRHLMVDGLYPKQELNRYVFLYAHTLICTKNTPFNNAEEIKKKMHLILLFSRKDRP
jgi:hypothetical protein